MSLEIMNRGNLVKDETQHRAPCLALKGSVLYTADFLLGLIIDVEDGGDMFLRNIGQL
jgi:hypothetical protein